MGLLSDQILSFKYGYIFQGSYCLHDMSLLNVTQISAGLWQVRGKRMTQRIYGNIFIDANFL
ncbi:MAG: hypothetical protein PWQ06_2870 [Anaerophaga sp.]|jgi:hypothetical protein|nr:hypothetical protein [Anaerophaga sp.]